MERLRFLQHVQVGLQTQRSSYTRGMGIACKETDPLDLRMHALHAPTHHRHEHVLQDVDVCDLEPFQWDVRGCEPIQLLPALRSWAE